MTVFTSVAVLALATSCQNVVAPMTILQIAQHEFGLDPTAVHLNVDGTRDLGLMQINERNFAWLGLRDPFDPCQSIAAAATLLTSYSRYNTGSPTRGLAYAMAVQAVRVVSDAATATAPPCPEPDPAGWHVMAVPRDCTVDQAWHAIPQQKDPR